MEFQNLTNIHSRWHTQWVQHNIHWSTVCEEWHIFFWKDTRNNTLITVTTCEFIALRNLTMLSNIHANHVVYASWKFIAVFFGIFASNFLNTNNSTILAVWYAQRSVTYFAALLTEDSAQQTLFWSQLSFTLRCNLTYQNIAWLYFGTHANNTAVIEVSQSIFTYVWKITSNFFCAELGFTSINLVLFNVNGRQCIVLNQTLRNNNCIFVVVTVPRHEGYEQVLTQSQFTLISCRTISQNRSNFNAVSFVNQRNLVVACGLIGALELNELVRRLSAIVVEYAN